MIKNVTFKSFALTVVLLFSMPMFTQEGSKGGVNENPTPARADKERAKDQVRYEGKVVRIGKDESTLTIRETGEMGPATKTIHYDNSTRWTSQEHGSKKANDIDPSQVKEGDRVIVRGTRDQKGEIHATLISKRLTPQAL